MRDFVFDIIFKLLNSPDLWNVFWPQRFIEYHTGGFYLKCDDTTWALFGFSGDTSVILSKKEQEQIDKSCTLLYNSSNERKQKNRQKELAQLIKYHLKC